MTIQENKKQLARPSENGEAAGLPFGADSRNAATQWLPCSRCGSVRPLTHRVRSDLIEQTVCEVCAADVPFVASGIGALTVERIPPAGESFTGSLAERF